LAKSGFDLLVTDIARSVNGNAFDLLTSFTQSNGKNVRILVLATESDPRQLAMLKKLPICGVFDPAIESTHEFKLALRLIAQGRNYWSRNLVELLRCKSAEPLMLARLLTTGEELLLTILGDGSDDVSAATELGLSPSTVTTVRRNLHRKLGVQHRGELIRVAARNGFVRFTSAGVVRPGFAALLSAWRRRKRCALDCAAA
jgi:DNA-binding NarL/FixJ family response regulator